MTTKNPSINRDIKEFVKNQKPNTTIGQIINAYLVDEIAGYGHFHLECMDEKKGNYFLVLGDITMDVVIKSMRPQGFNTWKDAKAGINKGDKS